MKAFVIAMVAIGTALFLAALFWPDQTQPVVKRPQHRTRTTATIETQQRKPAQTQADVWGAPPQPATPARPAMQTADTFTLRSNKPALEQSASAPIEQLLTPDEQETFKQTGTDDTSLRNVHFPNTYISRIHVDLASPNHWITLTWSGPKANLQPTTRYHSSPGRGLGNNNCDDPAESCRVDSNCTPKGTRKVQAYSNSMRTSPACRYVTWFDTKRGVALHYYPDVPNYPASHGCVRLGEYAAHLIHNNSKIGETEVVVEGKWTFGR